MKILAPSILSADFARLGEQVRAVDEAGAQFIHIDVMDGVCVPSISFGFPVIESIKPITEKVFDVHLMVIDPERYVDRFAEVGSDRITIHVEACKCMAETLRHIRELGLKAGVALHPETPVQEIYPYLEMIDQVTVMTVNTGFGGQKYIEECTQKIIDLHMEITRRHLDVLIEVDGGVKKDNADMILDAGAEILVAGSAVFKDDISQNVTDFMEILKRHE